MAVTPSSLASVVCRLVVLPDRDLQEFAGSGIGLAVVSWDQAREWLHKARGVAYERPSRLSPLCLTVENNGTETVADVWAHYRINVATALDRFSYRFHANFEYAALAPGERFTVALLDTRGWERVEAECKLTNAYMNEDELDAVPVAASAGTVAGPRPVKIVVHCPCGIVLNPLQAVVEFVLPHERAKLRFRHPRETEAARLRELPGLIATAELDERSGDLLRIAHEATAICDAILSSAFSVTLADLRKPQPILACDASAGLAERPFIHFFPDQMVVGRRAEMDLEKWGTAFDAVFRESNPRILRAVRWLRKMFTEDDMLDRFIAGWTGLETLNPLLCEHYGVDDHEVVEKACPSCKTKVSRKVPRAKGLKELLLREGSDAIYRECHNARNGLVHGFETIEEVTRTAVARVCDIGRLLAKGIALLTKLPLPTEADRFAPLAGPRIASVVFLEGTLQIPDLDAYEGRHGLPLFRAQIQQTGAVVGGQTELRGAATFDPPPECVVTTTAMGVSGPVEISHVTAKAEPNGSGQQSA